MMRFISEILCTVRIDKNTSLSKLVSPPKGALCFNLGKYNIPTPNKRLIPKAFIKPLHAIKSKNKINSLNIAFRLLYFHVRNDNNI